ncbi:acetate--CoA ligase [Streptomyces sp. NPDC052052]|uniref:acetate--CoA ligase n=1 Tax=Streptomyces sp. NPDC052052 TaxID=3154756 RepID=UPI00342FEFB4
MDHRITRDQHPPGDASAHLDHDRIRAEFTWDGARARLAGLPGGGLNMGYEAVDRQVAAGAGGREALRCVAADGTVTRISYSELAGLTGRFANVLTAMGVARQETVFTLLGRCQELFATVLGTLRSARVLCPLFPAFGPEPVHQRLELGDARVLVTTEELYRRKVEENRCRLPRLDHVLLVGPVKDPPPGTDSFADVMRQASPAYTVPRTEPEDRALLHFTSGTTGAPKGAIHVHEAVVAHHATAAFALDLRPGDVYWCTADPGWVTGTSYGIIAPLSHGVTLVVDEGEFDVHRWYRILDDQRVTVWYTAPTAIRMLMRGTPRTGPKHLPGPYDLSALRFVASVGEPLNPEAVLWGQDVLGLPIHDTWWQTETGAIMIANFGSDDVRPGSMGRPLPGVEAGLLERGEDGRAEVTGGRVRVIGEPDRVGELALRPGWPSMFRGYLHDEARYAACFAGGWYLTGDLARRDRDGWFWFVGRADDVIKSAGHLIGPFEVESALMEHPAVAEAGVIGRPDPVAGAVVKAFVSLRPEYTPDLSLKRDLLAFARRRLGPAVAPREIEFEQNLPRTRSGKVMRRVLRARETGLPEGDLSTVENPG